MKVVLFGGPELLDLELELAHGSDPCAEKQIFDKLLVSVLTQEVNGIGEKVAAL